MRNKKWIFTPIVVAAVALLLTMFGAFASDRGTYYETVGMSSDGSGMSVGLLYRVQQDRKLGCDRTLFASTDAATAWAFYQSYPK